MDFALSSLTESVSGTDADLTSHFYEARPAGAALRSHDEVLEARAARTEKFTGSDRAITGSARVSDRDVSIRIVEPRCRPIVGVLLHIPGGGFYMSSAVADDERNTRRADATGLVVVSVDYRLSPENPWPAAPDDCATAAEWLIAHAPERFGTDRLLLGGFSAGATLVAATLLRLRAKGIVAAFRGAVLEAGTYDDSAAHARSPQS